MKKQYIKLGSYMILLIICVAGYLFISNYYDNKEQEEENANKTIAFSLENYKETKSISYTNEAKTITLVRKNGEWNIKGDSKTDVDESVVETEMLSPLVEVISEEQIDDLTNLEDYGFVKKDEKVTASTNTITITDSKGEKHTIYIGDANPYDSTKYYMMVEGDKSVYVVDSSVADAFTKSIDDLEKEEETTTNE